MGIEEKVKGAGRGLKATGNYISPISYTPLDEHVREVEEHSDVRKLFEETDSQYHPELRQRLSYHLDAVRKESRRLKYFGAATDTIDKLLVPVDVVADSAGLLAGIGYGISVAKEMVELPFKVANSLYYTIKSGEWLTPIKDAGYELLSFIVPGSLLDLTNRYSNRVDKYVAKEAARRLVKEFKGKPRPFVDIGEEFRPQETYDLAA